MDRKCGDCQLCCKLVPVDEGLLINKTEVNGFHKKAGEKCVHQRRGKGCMIYPNRPLSCATWSCRWLVDSDTADLSRPDRAHYVIDILPDVITIEVEGNFSDFEVVQVWADPSYPDAWRTDKAFIDYVERRGAANILTMIRFDSDRAIVIFPKSITTDKVWHEVESKLPAPDVSRRLHGLRDLAWKASRLARDGQG